MKAVKTIEEIKDEVVKKAEESTVIKEEVTVAKKKKQEFVSIQDSERESLPIEEEITYLDEDKNKESIELVQKEDIVPVVEEKETPVNGPDPEVFSSEEKSNLRKTTQT